MNKIKLKKRCEIKVLFTIDFQINFKLINIFETKSDLTTIRRPSNQSELTPY